MRLPLRSLLAAAGLTSIFFTALAPEAAASGFQLREQSPSAQGNSYAGITAGGTDAGSMFFNVATLTLFDGNQVVAGASVIAPSAVFGQGSGSRAALFPAPVRPILGNTTNGNAGSLAPLPAVYALWSLSPRLKFGFSVNSPFGLGSDYDQNWVGRYHGLKSKMTVVELAPNLAFRINRRWSIGGAIVARHVDAELTNAVDFGAVGAALHIPGFVPGQQDGFAKVSGTQWKLGYKLGILFQPSKTVRIGAAYHSAIDFALDGKIRYEKVPTVLAARFTDGPATPKANQPATASLGLAWDLRPDVTLQAEVAKTFWKHFEEIRIEFASGQADSVIPEYWKNTLFLALGCTWHPNERWTFRAGIAHDQSGTTDQYRTPRIPDADRNWVSIGVGRAFSRSVSIDVSYSHIFVKDAVLALEAGAYGNPNFFRGDLSGRYKNKIDILAVQVKKGF